LRNVSDNNSLYDAYRSGKIPILSSDHAPHTIEEKRSDVPPSGMPGVETMIPLMLHEVVENRLDLGRLVNSMAEAPANRLGLDRGRIAEGQPADFMFVDFKSSEKISMDKLHSRANWSPFEGWKAIFPHKVYRRGELISENSEVVSKGGGKNLFD
jgi:dihydroorotase